MAIIYSLMHIQNQFLTLIKHFTNVLGELHTVITITNFLILIKLALNLSTKRKSFSLGHLEIVTLPLPLIQATLSSQKITLLPLKSSNVVKKNLFLVMCLEQPQSKCHSLGVVALRVVNTTLHLSLAFLT